MEYLCKKNFFFVGLLCGRATHQQPSPPRDVGQDLVPPDVLREFRARLGIKADYNLPIQAIGYKQTVVLPYGEDAIISLEGMEPQSYFSSATCFVDSVQTPCPDEPTVFVKTDPTDPKTRRRISKAMDADGTLMNIDVHDYIYHNGYKTRHVISFESIAPGIVAYIAPGALREKKWDGWQLPNVSYYLGGLPQWLFPGEFNNKDYNNEQQHALPKQSPSTLTDSRSWNPGVCTCGTFPSCGANDCTCQTTLATCTCTGSSWIGICPSNSDCCTTPAPTPAPTSAAPSRSPSQASTISPIPGPTVVSETCTSYRKIELAVTADSSFCGKAGNVDNVMAIIADVIDGAKALLEQEGLCYTVEILFCETYCDQASDPFASELGKSPTDILRFYANYYRQKRNGFTGSTLLDGGRNAGGTVHWTAVDIPLLLIGNIMQPCDTSGRADTAQACNYNSDLGGAAVACIMCPDDSNGRARLVAHELGHVLGAYHRDSKPGHIMCSGECCNDGAPQMGFSSGGIEAILAKENACITA